MRKTEWLACTDAEAMLVSLYGKARPRRLRLAAVACCRRVEYLLPDDERCPRALEVAEQYADRLADRQELARAHADAEAAHRAARTATGTCRTTSAHFAAEAVAWVSHPTMRHYPELAVARACCATAYAGLPPDTDTQEVHRPAMNAAWQATFRAESAAQALLVRDIIGNPFRPVAVPQALLRAWRGWQGGAVVRLARSIYDERRFGDLPVLADALEEAGCTDAEILGHLRGPGPHVRGCHILDALLCRQ